jgi:protein TonB
MVRTHPPVVPLQIDVSRVLGWSTALALHLLALMLLLIPAAYVAAPLPRDRTVVRIITPDIPTPKPPEPIKPEEPVPVVHAPTATPRVALLPPATATVDDVLAVPPLSAGEIQAPTLAPADPVRRPAVKACSCSTAARRRRAYPIAAIRDGQQGTVLLRVQVDPDGKAASVVIERSSGSRVLDNAARQQVLRHWRFVPGPGGRQGRIGCWPGAGQFLAAGLT